MSKLDYFFDTPCDINFKIAEHTTYLHQVNHRLDVSSGQSSLDVYDVDIRRHKHDQLRCL